MCHTHDKLLHCHMSLPYLVVTVKVNCVESETMTDDFGFCHVYYDGNDECEAVEIFSETDVNIDGKQIFPISLDEAYEVFPFLAEDEDGPLSIEKSIGIYAPDGEMESILFGKEGYYDYL